MELPAGVAVRNELAVAIAPVMPLSPADFLGTNVYPSPRSPNPPFETVSFIAHFHPQPPDWLHGDTGKTFAVLLAGSRVLAKVGPIHPSDPMPRLAANPFRIELFCSRDASGRTKLSWAEATALYPATLRDIEGARVELRSPTGTIHVLEPPNRRTFDAEPTECPEGEWVATCSDPRLSRFAGERRVRIAFPPGPLVVRTLASAAECGRSSPAVGEPFELQGAVASVRGNAPCEMFDWTPLPTENFAMVHALAHNHPSYGGERMESVTAARRPARVRSLAFLTPGTYEVELAVGHADSSGDGAAYAAHVHHERWLVEP